LYCLYFVIQLTTLMLVWAGEFSCWLILVRSFVFFVVGCPGHLLWWKKADLHHDGGNT